MTPFHFLYILLYAFIVNEGNTGISKDKRILISFLFDYSKSDIPA
ncbi:hypothetical protein HOLDEFILI_00269 [Holdemania filiformis DSM 12042]|uniref:Uncharacterized protein n=1 Tax=Holdemania filiformis DSM 12042 TaxID=545696 RepID=B9Y393_9FIRM|nr:hypothetical protein HOLDEFILI_00269 [Holdemania filiformis DSM 12042]